MRSLVLIVVLAAAASAFPASGSSSGLPSDLQICRSIFRPNEEEQTSFRTVVIDCIESDPGVKKLLAQRSATQTRAISSGSPPTGLADQYHGPQNPFKFLDEQDPAKALELRKCIATAKGVTTTDASGNVVFDIEAFKETILADAAATSVEAKVALAVNECSTELMLQFQAFPFMDCVKQRCVGTPPA